MNLKMTLLLRLGALTKAPMVAFLGVTVEEITATTCRVKVPLCYRTKNPVGGMFLGALTSGADIAGSLAAYDTVRRLKVPVSILFKDMNAKFLKKASTDVIFRCDEIPKIEAAVKETASTKEKVEVPLQVLAYAKNAESGEPLASFQMTLSVKAKR